MFVRRKKMAKNTRIAVQIVRNERQGSKVRQNIVEHVGMVDAKDDRALQAMVEEARKRLELRRFAKQFPVLPPEEGVLAALDQPDPPEHPTYGVDKGWCDPEASVAVGIHQVYGALYHDLGLNGLLPPRRYTASARALFHTVMARLAKPGSKRNNADTLENQLSIEMPLEKIYRMMNHLDEIRIKRLKALAAVRALGTSRPILDVLFFDCTTLYFESFDEDELRQRGYSKDGKRFETQVLLALMVTPEGLPVTCELLPGKKFEGTSLLKALENLRETYPIRRACVVADRGMMSAKNLRGLEQKGMDFVVGAKLRQMPAKRQEAWLKGENFRQLPEGGKLVDLPGEDGRWLIVHWSPRRAKKDREDREQLLEKLARKLEQNGTAKSMSGSRSERPFLRQSGASRFEIDYNKVDFP